MKEYKIVIRLGDIETPIISINAKDWEDLCDYVFGNIEIIDTEEEG